MLSVIERTCILNAVIAKLGDRRAREAKRIADGVLTNGATIPNPTGFDGVDIVGRRFRARIRYCDALTGADTRVTLGMHDTAEKAGYAYCLAHIRLWGSASRYTTDTF
jgi:hypothetical protein